MHTERDNGYRAGYDKALSDALTKAHDIMNNLEPRDDQATVAITFCRINREHYSSAVHATTSPA